MTKHTNEEAVTRVGSLAGVFNALCLPAPRAEDVAEFRLGHILPLQDYGAVLRIEEYDSNSGIGAISTDPWSVQPLHSFEYEEDGKMFRARLMPGITRVGISEEAFHLLSEAAAWCSYNLEGSEDIRNDDCGYLTCTIDGKVRVLPVLFDVTDVVKTIHDFDFNIQLVSGRFNRAAEMCGLLARAQDILYGDLRKKCDAMVATSGDVGFGTAYEFWSSMRAQMKNRDHGGIPPLHAAWNKGAYCRDEASKAERKRSSIVTASQNYAQTIREHGLHESLIPAPQLAA